MRRAVVGVVVLGLALAVSASGCAAQRPSSTAGDSESGPYAIASVYGLRLTKLLSSAEETLPTEHRDYAWEPRRIVLEGDGWGDIRRYRGERLRVERYSAVTAAGGSPIPVSEPAAPVELVCLESGGCCIGVYLTRSGDASVCYPLSAVAEFVRMSTMNPSALPAAASGRLPIMIGVDAQHTGRTNRRGPRSARVAWRRGLGSSNLPFAASLPVVVPDGTIYVGSTDGWLSALRPDGRRKWRFKTGEAVVSSPAVGADGTVYIGNVNGVFFAIRPDGTEKWRVKVGGHLESSPVVGSDGTIYVCPSGVRTLSALRPDGTVKWEFTTDAPFSPHCTPAVSVGGIVYARDSKYRLYAVNPDGSKRWSLQADAGELAVGADGTAFVGLSGALQAISPGGQRLWAASFEHGAYSAPALLSDGSVVLPGYGWPGFVVVSQGGVRRWNASGRCSVFAGRPVVDAGDIVYHVDGGGVVTAVNPREGLVSWTLRLEEPVFSAATIGDDRTLYVHSQNGVLYAVKEKP